MVTTNSPLSPRAARTLKAIEKYKTHDLSGREAFDFLRVTVRDPATRMTSEEFIVKTMSKDGILMMDLRGKTAARCPADVQRIRTAADIFGVVIHSEAAVEHKGGRPKKYKSKKATEEAARIHSATRSRNYRKNRGSASRLIDLGAIDSEVLPDAKTRKASKCLDPQFEGAV
jgi:hypothetical protein